MKRVLAACCVIAGSISAAAVAAPGPAYAGKPVSTPDDLRQIDDITERFRVSIAKRDARGLSKLLLNSDILFASPTPPAGIRGANQRIDENFNGLRSGGVAEFLQYLASSQTPIEERFFHLKTTQDGNVAWVVFDYEFVEDGKVVNYGIEQWQLLKTKESTWKIFSVVWSSHEPPAR